MTWTNKCDMDLLGFRAELTDAYRNMKFDDDELFEPKYSEYCSISEEILEKYAQTVTNCDFVRRSDIVAQFRTNNFSHMVF